MKQSIRSVYLRAEAFLSANPDLAAVMTAQEVRHLIALGVATTDQPERLTITTDGLAGFRRHIETFRAPFTASELAQAVFGTLTPTRYMILQAGKAAAQITGARCRKSNGRVVFDPIQE